MNKMNKMNKMDKMDKQALRAHALSNAKLYHKWWRAAQNAEFAQSCEETMYGWLFVWVRGEYL